MRALLPLLLASAAWAADPSQSLRLKTIDGAELRRLRDSGERVDLIDVRAPADFKERRIVGARNVPFYLVAQAGIPKTRTVVLYCSNVQCTLATESASALLAAGYRDVRVLEGGIEAATAAGMAVEGDVPARRVMTTARLAQRLAGKEPPVVVDSRPAAAFAAGRLPGARSLPLEALEKSTPDLPKDAEVVVYDAAASRRARAMRALTKGGWTVWELEGGPALWVQQGRPLESGVPPAAR